MLFGGYGLHYEVWLSYFGDTIVSFGGYIFIMVYGSLIWAGLWLFYLWDMVFILECGSFIWGYGNAILGYTVARPSL